MKIFFDVTKVLGYISIGGWSMSRDNTNHKQMDRNKKHQFLLRAFFGISFITVAIVGVIIGSYQVLLLGYGFIFLACGILGIVYKIPVSIHIFKNNKSFRFIDYFNCYLLIFVGLSLLLIIIVYKQIFTIQGKQEITINPKMM